MKKIKYILIIFSLFLLVGCGANIDYKVDVNTSEKSIRIETTLEIDESDYTYIKGGREKLISIMQKDKPTDLNFAVDKNNENKFIFSLIFTSYDDYLSKYKAITGKNSSSVFEIGEYSKESPFEAFQKIKFEDDLSNLLNWLKKSLISSGSIDSEHKDAMINNQNYQFIFDGENSSSYSYKKEYEGKTTIPVTQNNVKIIIKKENQIDFYMTLIIEEDKVGNFTENLTEFMKDKNVKLEHKNIDYSERACIEYKLEMNNLDLTLEDSIVTLNSAFGNGFFIGKSYSTKESSIIKDDYQQTLNLELDFYSLFGLQKIHPVEIVIDVDGVSLNENKMKNQDIEMPLTIQKLNNGNFYMTLETAYTSYNIIIFVGLFIFIVILIGCLWKFGFKKAYHKIQCIAQIAYKKLENIIKHYFYENEFKIEGHLLVGESFTIQSKNINKIYYGKQYEMLSSMYKYIVVAILGGILLTAKEFNVAGCLLLIGAIILFIIGIIKYRTKAIYIKLVSGKEYSFVFENQEKASNMYTELLEIIEQQNELDEDMKTIFMTLEDMGEEKNEEA